MTSDLGNAGDVGGDIGTLTGTLTSARTLFGAGMDDDFSRFCSIGFCSADFSGVTGGEIGSIERLALFELRRSLPSKSMQGEAGRLDRISKLLSIAGAERLPRVELPLTERVVFEVFESRGHELRCFKGGEEMSICGATTLQLARVKIYA